MALKLDYDFDGDIYPNAYLRIQKIVLGKSDQERLVNEGDHLVSEWDTVEDSAAKVFVYGDEEARQNNARPIHMFGIEFDYCGGDAYSEAYEALKHVERFKDCIIEDV